VKIRRLILTLALGCTVAYAELPAEPVPNVTTLTTPYPDHYAVVHDFAFSNLIDSKFVLVDLETRKFLGMMSAGQFATISLSRQRGEFYVGETYHSHGSRGDRSDLVTVYDMETLGIIKEIELPPKRANNVVLKANTRLTADQRFFLVFNMNPAQSVTVIDLDSHSVVGEIPTPGCALIYETQEHGFFMLCGDGGLLAVTLDDKGQPVSKTPSKPFIDIDADPLSEKATNIDGVWHFVSYRGEVQPIDARTNQPKPGKRWWLTSDAERKANWRPAGWHWTASLSGNRLWVGMMPDGYQGSHKDPATEVWYFDSAAKKRKQRIALKVPAIAIDVVDGDTPLLLVVNVEASLDIYDATSGEYLRSIHDIGETPYMVHRME
jgi:methylamine dehydrogenase heavy chain